MFVLVLKSSETEAGIEEDFDSDDSDENLTHNSMHRFYYTKYHILDMTKLLEENTVFIHSLIKQFKHSVPFQLEIGLLHLRFSL